jgi:hypothetical protein
MCLDGGRGLLRRGQILQVDTKLSGNLEALVLKMGLSAALACAGALMVVCFYHTRHGIIFWQIGPESDGEPAERGSER